MEYATLSAESIVKSANEGDYAVPEFQRGFVWTETQVLEFADSLSRDFPVGSMLNWKSNTAIQRGDTGRQKSWPAVNSEPRRYAPWKAAGLVGP